MITYLEAIRQALIDEMERDPSVFIIGEDIGEYGGAFKVTAGFVEQFGNDRVLDSPISEAALVGAAIGASMFGKRPVVEMQFIDFIANGFNQIVNFAAKLHYRLGTAASIVIRGPAGGGVRGGPFHSQSPESFFANVPGLKIVMPATVADASGLLKSAIRDPNPVLFFEHKKLYRHLKADISDAPELVPIGKARVARSGADLTMVSWGAMVHSCLDAAATLESEGIHAEVVDLRTLVPLDEETIFASVKKTSRLMVVHEAPSTGGFGGEVAARVAGGVFEWLDAPVVRVAAKDTPIPYAAVLEDAMMPQTADILEAGRNLARY